MEDVNSSPRRWAAAACGALILAGTAAAVAHPPPGAPLSRPSDHPIPTERNGPRYGHQPKQESEEDQPRRVPYINCTQVINDGAWPLYRGQPGYSPLLDRDGDGIACN